MTQSRAQTTGRRRPVAETVAEAEWRSTAAARLAELSSHPSASVRAAVAENPACDDETVVLLARDAKELVRLSAAGNAADRPGVEPELAASTDPWVRAILAHTYATQPNKQLLRAVQELLAADTFREVRQRIAETTAHRDLYDQLLTDPEPRVRGTCSWNPRASAEDVERLLTDRHRETRAMAIDHRGAALTPEQWRRAARDPSAVVRWATLYSPGAPDLVAQALVDDADDDVRHAAQSASRDRGEIWDREGEAAAVADQAVPGGVTWRP